MVKILSIDIGKKNFSFTILEFDEKEIPKIVKYLPEIHERYNVDSSPTLSFKKYLEKIYCSCKILEMYNLDLTHGCNKRKTLDYKLFDNLYKKLDEFITKIEKVDTILIEQQMSFRGKCNMMAIKIAAATYMYFVMRYKNSKKIIDFPAYYKSSVLGMPKIEKKSRKGIKWVSNTKYQRKKWSKLFLKDIIEKHYTKKIMDRYMSFKPKLDDISDTALMVYSYISLHYFDNKKF